MYDKDEGISDHLSWEHYASVTMMGVMLVGAIIGVSVYNQDINEANKMILGTDSGMSSQVIVEQSKGESISNFLMSQNENINNVSNILNVIDVQTDKMLDIADRNAFKIKTDANYITDDVKNSFNPIYDKYATNHFQDKVIDPYMSNDFINENIEIGDYVQMLEAVYNVKAAHHFNQDVFKYDIKKNKKYMGPNAPTYQSDWMEKMGTYMLSGEKSNQEIFQFINIDYEKIDGTDKNPSVKDFSVTQSSSANDSLQTNTALQMFLHLDPNALAEITPNKITLDNFSSTTTYDNTKQAMKIGLDGQVVEKTESLKQ